MAHHAQRSANRFAQSPEHLTDYNQQEGDHHSISSLEHSLNSNLSNRPNSSLDNANEPLRVHVERVVRRYFAALGNEMPTDLYALILKEVEQPLLTVVLEQTRGNQTKCAQILGLNRGTLRKKLKAYDLM